MYGVVPFFLRCDPAFGLRVVSTTEPCLSEGAGQFLCPMPYVQNLLRSLVHAPSGPLCPSGAVLYSDSTSAVTVAWIAGLIMYWITITSC